jgi:beta-glucanase (GH16 family)
MWFRSKAKATAMASAVPVLLAAAGCSPPAASVLYEDPNGPVVWQPGNWTVVWRDEFDGPAGTPPDPTHWAHELGGTGWGNRELQDYTDSPSNAALDGDGHLLITARAETVGANAYTSARLTTDGLFAQAYGRFEARIRLVKGAGLWPAFWILGDNFHEVGWPTSGEMDIVEQRGDDVTTVSSSLHGPVTEAAVDAPVTRYVPVAGGADAGFHVYAVEWDPDNVVFLLDDVPFFQITPARRPGNAIWVWDHPFFIILNLAVGGLFPGAPDPSTVFPQSLTVDYVRVSVRAVDGGQTDGGSVDDAADAPTSDAPDAPTTDAPDAPTTDASDAPPDDASHAPPAIDAL